ncbi:WD40 repeat domain-containing protein [Synechococcus sp. CBW1107]|nr:WD40 repeat domain-containing protein [Synechococcus sp. CBW1107]
MNPSARSPLNPTQIKRYGSRLRGEQFRPLLPRRWQQKRAIRKLANDGTPDAVAALAEGIAASLLPSTTIFEAVVAPLAHMAAELHSPFGELVASLVNKIVAKYSTSNTLHRGAIAALDKLAHQLDSPASIDLLCRHWIECGDAEDELARLLVNAGHAPSDAASRALFWMLSGQLQRYEQLDLDSTLLAEAMATASPAVRKRLATVSAKTGRTQWLRAMLKTKQPHAFSDDDWATSVKVLKQAGDLEAIWKWAFMAPPIYGRLLVQAIPAGIPPPARYGEIPIAELLSLSRHLPEQADWIELEPVVCTDYLQGHEQNVMLLAWSPDGLCLASCSSDKTIRLWDPVKGVCTRTFKGHSIPVSSIAWSPNGLRLASIANRGKWIRLWDPYSGVCTNTLKGHSSGILTHAWSPNGRILASGSIDKTIRLWDPALGACAHTLEGHTKSVNSVAWSPDGRSIASTSIESTIRLWNPYTGKCTHILQGHKGSVNKIAWSPDGRFLASNAFDGKRIHIWNPLTGTCFHILQGHAGSVNSIAWSPDGRWLASCSTDKTIRLWDPRTGECCNTISDNKYNVKSISWSPDGRYLTSIEHDYGKSQVGDWGYSWGHSEYCAKLYRTAGWTAVSEMYLGSNSDESFTWSPSGRCLATASGETIKLWKNKIENLIFYPLMSFTPKDREFLADSQKDLEHNPRWSRPWLDFIVAICHVINRFDVIVDDLPISLETSSFEVEVDD